MNQKSRILVFGFLVAFGSACSDDSPSGDGDGDPTPGDGDGEVIAGPVSTGPGLSATAPLECPEVECSGRPDGSFTLQSRCESSGTWSDESCPAAQFGWTQGGLSGSLNWVPGAFEFEFTSNISWAIEYPDSCGGCDAVEAMSGLSSVECSPSDGVCSCTATSVETGSIDASETSLADGYRITTRSADGDISEFDVQACTNGSALVLYYEDGKRFYFEQN